MRVRGYGRSDATALLNLEPAPWPVFFCFHQLVGRMVAEPATGRGDAVNRDRLDALLVPRAIAWLTTMDTRGRVVVAPFDRIIPLPGTGPEARVLLVLPRGANDEQTTTERNIAARPEFVLHAVDERNHDHTIETIETPAEPHDPDLLHGFATVASEQIGVPRLADAWAAAEFVVERHQPLATPGATMVVARVVHWHLHERLAGSARPRFDHLRPVGSLGGHAYCPVRNARNLVPAHLANP